MMGAPQRSGHPPAAGTHQPGCSSPWWFFPKRSEPHRWDRRNAATEGSNDPRAAISTRLSQLPFAAVCMLTPVNVSRGGPQPPQPRRDWICLNAAHGASLDGHSQPGSHRCDSCWLFHFGHQLRKACANPVFGSHVFHF